MKCCTLGVAVLLVSVGAMLPSAAGAQETEAAFEAGWTKLPVQMKLEKFTLYCRDARIVLYATIDYRDIDLKEEAVSVITSCGGSAAGKVGILKLIAAPTDAFSDFSDEFSACVSDTIVNKSRAVGLYTRNEHGDWQSC